MKQIAINLVPINYVGGAANTILANPGMMHCYNILDAPLRYRQTAVLFVKPSQATITRSAKGTYSEDSKNPQ